MCQATVVAYVPLAKEVKVYMIMKAFLGLGLSCITYAISKLISMDSRVTKSTYIFYWGKEDSEEISSELDFCKEIRKTGEKTWNNVQTENKQH